MKTDDSQLKLENKGVWIPISIWDNKDLTLQEKAILVKVESFKECFASNDYLAEFVNVSVSRIKQVLKSLEEKGYIYRVVQRKEKAIVKRIISVDKAKFYGIAVETENYPNSDIGQETIPSKDRKLSQVRTGNYPDNSKDNSKDNNKVSLSSKPDVAQKKPRPRSLDYSSWPELPDQQILDDWLELRKRMRAPVSQTVINRFGKELHNAVRQGYSVDACLTEVVTRGWRGFEAQWLVNIGMRNQANYPNQPQQSSAGVFINKHTDTSWAE